jgi:hypothetical protein
MALVPVAASGPHAIVGNEIILAEAGQEVTLEIRVSDWDPYLLFAWQAFIDMDGFSSGDAGTTLPLGWDRPFEWMSCMGDADCPPGLSCHPCILPSYGVCVGPDYNPEAGAFIDASRPDYVFYGIPEVPAVDLLWYRFGSALLNLEHPEYFPPPKYCATLILVVSEDAAGTFTIGLIGEDSFLLDASIPTWFIPTELIPASITIAPGICGNGACEDGEDETSCPADCTSGRGIRPIRFDQK